jgi:hypothetical protein
MIGTGRKALDHKAQEPCEADADRPTDPAQGDVFAQQMLNQHTLLASHGALFGAGDTLASAGFALVVLLAAVYMAVFLKLH